MTEAAPILIEQATAADMPAVAELYLASRADALPWIRRVHDDAETRHWVTRILPTYCEIWVARYASEIAGFMALNGDDLDQLYLLPGWYRRGIGSLLLARARERRPFRLTLFTFQRNARARAFYEAHGFRIVEMTDGAGNEEGEPDILYAWGPGES